MKRVLPALVASLALVGSASARSGPSLSVRTGAVHSGDRIALRLAGAAAHERLAVFLQVWPLVGAPRITLARVRANAHGTARVSVRLPELAAAVYRPWLEAGKRTIAGHGLLSVAAEPPQGLGALGAPGCAPASPESPQHDVFGTSAGAQLWALPFATTGGGGASTLTGVVGKTTKIAFKLTSGVPTVFYAAAPDGTRVAPVWGPDSHLGSNWSRPGAEWGAGFAFDRPGCWRIHAATGRLARGDVWLEIDS